MNITSRSTASGSRIASSLFWMLTTLQQGSTFSHQGNVWEYSKLTAVLLSTLVECTTVCFVLCSSVICWVAQHLWLSNNCRYVNRKGVALPTSSEETKRAKRENLEQKQILVPELCTLHPFPASLWRKAVCLPCILYRINALLLADQIRREVAISIALGHVNLSPSENLTVSVCGFT